MPYIKEICKAGKTIETAEYYTSRYGCKGQRRAAHREPTPEAMRRVNERQAATKLRRLINANFGTGDVHLVLNYRREYTPETEEARKHLGKFLRTARKYCREQGKELRYITVTEYKRTRVHHHLVIQEIPARVLAAMWPYGRAHSTPLDGSGQYGKLAEYLLKETGRSAEEAEGAYRKRWNQSKNLIIPEPKKRVMKPNRWRREPKPRKGYYIDKESVREGIHEVTGYPYRQYIQVQLCGG